MSRYSSTVRPLIRAEIHTDYADEYNGARAWPRLEIQVGGHEWSIEWRGRWWPLHRQGWRFSHQHSPFDPEDSEGMYWEVQRKKNLKKKRRRS